MKRRLVMQIGILVSQTIKMTVVLLLTIHSFPILINGMTTVVTTKNTLFVNFNS